MAKTPTPTKAELRILRALWQAGPSTVREVHEQRTDARSVAYTTTLKALQVMTAKGLVLREERGMQHLYRARDPERRMQRRLVTELLDLAFGGSMKQLVLQVLASRRTSDEELEDIRRIVAEARAIGKTKE
jgi:predicted transcriptional regulator